MTCVLLQISRVPTLPRLPNLTRLNLSRNQLDSFPPSLCGDSLPRLTVLDLRSNVMTTVPRNNTGLRELEVLNISKNQIKELPDQFLASLPSIKTLDASWNELGLLVVILSHPHSLTPSHCHALTPSHPHTVTLTPSHCHALTPSHPHTVTLTPSHPHTVTPSLPHRVHCRRGLRRLCTASGVQSCAQQPQES